MKTRDALAALKREAALRFKKEILSNISLLKVYHSLVKNKKIKKNKFLENLLKVRAVRTLSGVAIIAVLTKPFPCPDKSTANLVTD